MKKQLFLICMMISIANLHAMEDAKMQSAHNSEDDELEKNRNRFNEKRDQLLSEMDAITQDLIGLHIQANTLEEIIRSKDGLRKFTLLKKLKVKPGRKAKKIKKESIKEELAQEHCNKWQKKSYIQTAMYFDQLETEEMVLLEAIKGMEALIDRVAGPQSTKQPAIAQQAKKDIAPAPDDQAQPSLATQSTNI